MEKPGVSRAPVWLGASYRDDSVHRNPLSPVSRLIVRDSLVIRQTLDPCADSGSVCRLWICVQTLDRVQTLDLCPGLDLCRLWICVQTLDPCADSGSVCRLWIRVQTLDLVCRLWICVQTLDLCADSGSVCRLWICVQTLDLCPGLDLCRLWICVQTLDLCADSGSVFRLWIRLQTLDPCTGRTSVVFTSAVQDPVMGMSFQQPRPRQITGSIPVALSRMSASWLCVHWAISIINPHHRLKSTPPPPGATERL
ncbi:unnamed protein product [Pleuronectes platessa]|uniref:Uncharacterized protein n=1 Tax=Pleuronectes platessa TaxID=8262 RepID=A0A9N7Y6W6_PLEPL|nr:unnamed protein product [Pleuronectes platessa]